MTKAKNFPAAKASFDLETFTFNGKTLRTVVIDGKPWFAALDIFTLLGAVHSNVSNYKARHLDASEWCLLERSELNQGTPIQFEGGSHGTAVNMFAESALYKVLMRAQRSNPAAREVQDWVTKEVLPRIRKNGGNFWRTIFSGKCFSPIRELPGPPPSAFLNPVRPVLSPCRDRFPRTLSQSPCGD